MLVNYYAKQVESFQNKERAKIYEINKKPITYAELIKQKPVFLLHGITEGEVGSNSAIDREITEGRGDIKFKNLLLGPMVSTFTFEEGQAGVTENNRDQLWGNNYVLYGKDAVVSNASPEDYKTVSTGFRSRVSRGDIDEKVFNYESVAERTAAAVADKNRESHNELLTQGLPVGYVVNLGNSADKQDGYRKFGDQDSIAAFERVKLAQKEGLDIFALKNGKMHRVNNFRDRETIKQMYSLPATRSFLKSENQIDGLKIDLEDMFVLGEEITPEEVAQMDSPLQLKRQGEIAKELMQNDQMQAEYFKEVGDLFLPEGDEEFQEILERATENKIINGMSMFYNISKIAEIFNTAQNSENLTHVKATLSENDQKIFSMLEKIHQIYPQEAPAITRALVSFREGFIEREKQATDYNKQISDPSEFKTDYQAHAESPEIQFLKQYTDLEPLFQLSK